MSDMQHEYQNFISDATIQVPALSETTLKRVSRDIAPTFGQVLTKLIGLHVIALTMTLTVCPQFGLGPIGSGHGIMHIVMRYGEVACALFCAAFLFGTTLLLSRLFLSKYEANAMRSRTFFAGSSIAALSFAFFMLLDALTASVVVNLSTGIIWTIAGAMILSSIRLGIPQKVLA